MAKRKRSTTISEDSLERARQQVTPQAEDAAEKPKPAAPPSVPVARSTRSVSERRADRRASTKSAAQQPTQFSQINKKSTVLTNDRIAELLAKPTKMVTEAELRQEYLHVVRDIRSMFVLAAALMILLVVLAQVI